MGCPIRKSTDQSLFAAPHGLSQRITSFIACACQGIHQMPLRHLIVLIAHDHRFQPLTADRLSRRSPARGAGHEARRPVGLANPHRVRGVPTGKREMIICASFSSNPLNTGTACNGYPASCERVLPDPSRSKDEPGERPASRDEPQGRRSGTPIHSKPSFCPVGR